MLNIGIMKLSFINTMNHWAVDFLLFDIPTTIIVHVFLQQQSQLTKSTCRTYWFSTMHKMQGK